jgi:Ni/Co efflux regulator RcnB
MKKRLPTAARQTLLVVSALLASTCAFADNGDKHGHGHKHEHHDDDRRDDEQRNDVSLQIYFGNNDRRIVNEYYAPEFHAGHCPPGLAKKRNGCMPPGQAKKWSKGRPLPPGVAYYELPPDLVYRMPPPPRGHRYVRVGSDILLLSIGSGIVIDAMIDIGR